MKTGPYIKIKEITLADLFPLPNPNTTKIYIVYQYNYNYSNLLKAFRNKSDAEDFKAWHLQNTHIPIYIEEMELE